MNDQERLKTLEDYQILDSLPEREFDDIVELASAFFHTPISLISILDSHRQWFKAKIGLDTPETPIEQAFCYHAIQQPTEVMVVRDSLKDDRFRNNPLAIGSPHVRFYAGAPLVTSEGVPLGTLCVIDNHPRNFSEEQKRVLKILAEKVIERLDMRKQNLNAKREVSSVNQKLEFVLTRLLEAEHLAQIGNWGYDPTTLDMYWSPEIYRLLDKKENEALPTASEWNDTIHAEDRDRFYGVFQTASEKEGPFSVEFRVIKKDGTESWLLSRGVSESDQKGHIRMKGTLMNITERKRAEKNTEHYVSTLEEMLFAISHKIRKPVATVLGIVKEMSKGDQTEREYSTYLKTASEELDTYIHELNDFIQNKKIGMHHNNNT